MTAPVLLAIERGLLPAGDGWGWFYHTFDRLAPRGSRARRLVCRCFYPCRVERWRAGLVYRVLGVRLFGRIIPTGGITVRRLIGARMAPYTLSGTSLGAAREFYYRTCVFEACHLPFFLALLGLALHRMVIGRADLAIENTLVNLLVNAYPMMHHRRTRARIVALLEKEAAAAESQRGDSGSGRGTIQSR